MPRTVEPFWRPHGCRSVRSSVQAGSALRLHPPELEALRRDGLLDRPPGELVRRGLAGTKAAGQSPGAVLRGKFAAGFISRKCVQVFLGLRGEHEKTHRN